MFKTAAISVFAVYVIAMFAIVALPDLSVQTAQAVPQQTASLQ